ncbi:MAG: hypothetical protein IKG70_07770 [Lachnospiraceae bacterium]|nr:hypothetical protein [Lachnospiraceae bacterium]
MNFRKSAAVILAVLMTAIMIAGCGKVNSADAALVINGETINAGTASTYLRYQQAATNTMMKYYGLIDEETAYWDNPAQGDVSDTSSTSAQSSKTYGESFRDDVRDSIVNMAVIRQHADEFGFSLSEEQKQKITETAAQFISDNGSVANWIGADQQSVENMLSLIAHQLLMRDLIIADTDREVSDEEAAQSTIVYARLSRTTPADYEGTDEEYAEEARSNVEELISRLTSGSEDQAAEDPAAENQEDSAAADTDTEEVSDTDAVSAIATEINESFSVSSASFGDDDTILDDAVKEAAKTLADGETYASVIETEDYLYAVKMIQVFDAAASDAHRLSIISSRENENYNNKVDAWVAEAQVTEEKAWTQLKVTNKENYVAAE